VTTDPSAPTQADLFLNLIRPTPRNPQRTVEDDDYVRMMLRMVRALEARAINNPAIIADVVALAQRLAEVTNVAIACNAQRFAVDPRSGASAAECGRVLGIAKQSVSERRKLGEKTMAERIEAAGAVKFSEAKREAEIVRRAAEHAVVSLADWRERRSA
jgi:hypothetical protein